MDENTEYTYSFPSMREIAQLSLPNATLANISLPSALLRDVASGECVFYTCYVYTNVSHLNVVLHCALFRSIFSGSSECALHNTTGFFTIKLIWQVYIVHAITSLLQV